MIFAFYTKNVMGSKRTGSVLMIFCHLYKISDRLELLAMQAELLISNNLALNNIAMSLAELMELEAVKLYQAQTPIDQPVLSEWPDDVFKRLTD